MRKGSISRATISIHSGQQTSVSAVPVQGIWGAATANVRQDDNSEDESSTSSSEKGKENTTSDSKPSSTNDSSFRPKPDSVKRIMKSQARVHPKREKKTPRAIPSLLRLMIVAFKGPANGDGDGESSGSSSTDNDTTSDTNPSSTDDSSVEEKEDRDAQDDEEADDPVNSTKVDACQVPSNGNFGSTSSGGRGLQYFLSNRDGSISQ